MWEHSDGHQGGAEENDQATVRASKGGGDGEEDGPAALLGKGERRGG